MVFVRFLEGAKNKFGEGGQLPLSRSSLVATSIMCLFFNSCLYCNIR